MTTRWSVVLAAQDKTSPESEAALETLCRAYWYPLYAYVRGTGRSPHDAQELTQEFFARLEEEKNAVLRALGIVPDPMSQMFAAAGGNPMDTMFDFLPEAKRTTLMQTMGDFQSKIGESAGEAATDPGAVVKAQREMEAAIQAVLTPEEFLDYQLRFSMTATMLRQQIAGFEPSAKEFLAVFKLREEFDREYSPMLLAEATEAEQAEHRQAQEQMNQQLRAVLGEQRYADYERAQDYQYQQLHRIVQRAGLPPAAANEVHDLRKIAENQANQVRSNPNLPPEQRNAVLRAIRQETERTIQQKLGDEAWSQYNRPHNTWWLRKLTPDELPVPLNLTLCRNGTVTDFAGTDRPSRQWDAGIPLAR